MIGKKLRELITLRGIKQNKLAKYAGISPSRLSNYLSDKREPDLELLASMARYLSVDLNYFTDIRFPTQKKATYNVHDESVESMAADKESKYVASDSAGFINIPHLPINSKKKASRTSVLPISSLFLAGVKNPAENAVLFEVTADIEHENLNTGDFVLAQIFEPENTPSGSFVFETGRNGKTYQYIKNDKDCFFLANGTNELTALPDDKELQGFYTIVWTFKKL